MGGWNGLVKQSMGLSQNIGLKKEPNFIF